ncbi:NAD(P)/FAD-dependent oxidoreductase [Polyangium jinanense]|uniref:NADH:ubiquinone reductase (non-electrogenic) n=1 Tax=Polyangium jinanense TaxID=2829994 RepID=A0A9X4ATY1_9BACT|nr:NAD(P)/FAD-dependent oxidoreductase [Polyangium jinanense]MDC3960856.1 NAD(P)/FAD-dependent oxidoreductase [Polyangium jinanense]MDC3984679.1 NAD(P)/FAD-dependent oxidoreductase [Polyangium jinanense]
MKGPTGRAKGPKQTPRSARIAQRRSDERGSPITFGEPGRTPKSRKEPLHLPHVVIVGGGFGGLYAAKALRHAPVRITLLDRKNHHLFQPLLYQVATAGLNPAEIAAPIRRVLRDQRNVRVLLGEVTGIDPKERTVTSSAGTFVYDYLILATGASHSYFGHEEWAPLAPGLKSLEDALEIRRRVLLAFEKAECCAPSQEDRSAWLTFVIVGGGPTGVELAGTLAEVAHHTVANDFRVIDPTAARIVLVEGIDRVLPTYSALLSARAERQLQRLGVEVRTNARVTGIDAEGVQIGEERIAAKTVLWAAGVKASPLGEAVGAPLDRAGRVKVAPDLSVPGHPEIFVIGDLAALEQDGSPVPGLAPAAIQEARHTARNIVRSIQGEPRQPFRYLDKGTLATIGRNAAVANFGRLELSGFVAWLAWLLIHVFFLIGFRNRFLVLFDWAFSYLTYERGARLITESSPKAALTEPASRR